MLLRLLEVTAGLLEDFFALNSKDFQKKLSGERRYFNFKVTGGS